MSTEFINDQWRLPNAWNGSESNVNKQSNYSMDFDSGSSDYIAINNNTTLNSISDSVSISQWIKFSGTSQQYVTSFGNDYGTYVINGKFYFVFRNTSNTQIQLGSNSTINDGSWHHVVAVKTTSNITIYIDGVLDKTDTTGDVGRTSTRSNAIGALYDGSINFDGSIDAVSIFNYALTDGTGGTVNQIATLYGSSSTGIGNPMSLSPKPVAYYPLGDQDAFNGANYLVPNSSLKDYVFDFDVIAGVGDSISATNVLPSASDFTISLWVNPDSSQLTYATTILFGNLPNGENLQIVSRFTNGYFYVSNGSVAYISQLNAVQANVWTLITVTYDNTAGVLTAYINGGESVYTSSSGTTLPTQAFGNIMYIGRGSISTTHFQGKISNTQIFDTALSASEVETLYNYGSPIRTLANIPQSSNLQGWWKLNASDTYDSSTGNWTIEDHAGSNDGTSSGMTQANLVQSDLSFTSGYSPYALDFDAASSDRIDFTGLPDFGGGSLSISFWIKSGIDASNAYVLMRSGFSFYIFQSGTASNLRYRIQTSSLNTINGGAILDNTWHHCIMIFDSSANEFKVFEDGNQVGSTVTTSGSLASSTSTVYLASFATGAPFKGGSFSNLSMWNAALTSAQVTEIYNEGVPSNLNNHSAYSNLVSWWQLGSNSSFNTNWTVLDEKGSNNGTSVNMGEDAIVDGVGSYANGLSSGMGGDEVIGDAPYSTANALSVNMDVEDRVEDTPS